tara:strand:- start:1283 stop:3502 length:2220 start_codon:yes stop_codon:yes gene_type:complete
MKKVLFFLALFLSLYTYAEDTTFVRAHDNVDMTWYGHYKQWGVFPDGTEEYRKIMLHYTMGCASTGCSGWDYTTHITLRHRTGEYDSTLTTTPNFTVDGSVLDSLYYSYSPTFYIQLDSLGSTDTIFNEPISIIYFNDPSNPLSATDSSIGYVSNYFYYNYDSLGLIIDSTWVQNDSVIYLTNYYIYNTFEIIEEYELGRAITPYGTYMQAPGSNGYDPNWKHVFSYDITDFAHLLVDSVEIDAFYSGWSSGFSVTTDFEFISGVPPRKVLNLSNLYKNAAASYNYSSSIDFETNQMPQKKLHTLANASEHEFRFVPSGHGQAGEFTPNIYYYLYVNGNNIGSNEMWKDDCGFNAIYPQGGTWIFDRANWCPGEAVPIFKHNITNYITPGDSALFDIDFTSFNASAGASYSCAAQFFEFGPANYVLNVEVEDIISPSNKDMHMRFNPVCGNPEIMVKNLGKTLITDLTIEYEMEGGTTETFQWNGSIKYLESERIVLPSFLFNGNENKFNVRLINPNGGIDEQPENDAMSSYFELVPNYQDGNFKVVIQANNYGAENSWVISDENGTALYWRFGLNSNQYNIDTVNLDPGCYTFELTDSNKDGMDFWWSNATTGTGTIKFQQVFPPFILKTFQPDFGSKIVHHFTVAGGVSSVFEEKEKSLNIFPNPSSGTFTIDYKSEKNKKIKLELTNISGMIIWEKEINNNSYYKTHDLTNYPNGLYLLKIKDDESVKTKKIILNR